MTRKDLAATLLLALMAGSLQAQDDPATVSGPMTRYSYEETADPVINCLPNRFCRLQLEPGETLSGVAASNPAWSTDQLPSGPPGSPTTHVLVWPSAVGDEGSLLVTTDRRIYSLRLSADRDRPVTPVVAFSFKGSDPIRFRDTAAGASASIALTAGTAFDPERVNLSYRVGRDRTAPSVVFDDGVKTYLFWKRGRPSEAPIVKAVDEEGQEILLNPHVFENGYTVDAVVPRLLLVKGRKTVTITNEALRHD
jgi:type IV secretory pathway VirB9-like protein